MIKRRSTATKGMTLIELTIVIALVAVIATVGYNALYYGLKSYSEAQKKWEAEVAVRYTTELLNKHMSSASFLDIRSAPAASWFTSPSYQYIFISDGNVMYQNSTGSAVPLVDLAAGQMAIEFTKPLNTSDGNTPHHPVSNVLSYKVIAKDSAGRELYSLTSSVMLRNFLPGTALPTDSLYSAPNMALYLPGNGIKYWNDIQAIVPRFPAVSYSCGCGFGAGCGCNPSDTGDLNSPPD